MITLGLDVGITTGIVIADCIRKRIPEIHESFAYDLRDTDPYRMFRLIEAQVIPPGLRTIVVEWPWVDPLDRLGQTILAARDLWKTWVDTLVAQLPSRRLIVVTPSQWKSTPAKKFPVYRRQLDQDWVDYRPSYHELDAARILYWFSFWGELPGTESGARLR